MTERVRVDTRLKSYERNTITSAAYNMLKKRRGLARTAWDDDPYKFYLSLFPVEIRTAMERLSTEYDGRFKGMINTADHACVEVYVDGKDDMVRIGWDGDRACIPSGWQDDNGIRIKEAHPAFPAIEKFVQEYREIVKIEKKVDALVEHCVEKCNTFGQIHRVWPDLLPTIGGHKVVAAEKQLRKSSLPWDLKADEIVQFRDQYTLFLAQGAILPSRQLTTYLVE